MLNKQYEEVLKFEIPY